MSKGNPLKSLDNATLKRWLSVFFLALAIPAAILVYQAFSRLKWETFHQHQLLAQELTQRIDNELIKLINAEERRAVTDYAFLNYAGDPAANFLQRSPLSRFPVESNLPGVIGYFQVDAAGNLATPLVPEDIAGAGKYGLASGELNQRLALQSSIQQILQNNRLLSRQEKSRAVNLPAKVNKADKTLASTEQEKAEKQPEASEEKYETASADAQVQGQAMFDELKKIPAAKPLQTNQLGRVEELKLKRSFPAATDEIGASLAKGDVPGRMQKSARTEQSALPESVGRRLSAQPAESQAPVSASPPAPAAIAAHIRTFESAVDPFEFSQLDSGQWVLFRKVWHNRQRYVQGLLIEENTFIRRIMEMAFRESSLAQMSDLLVVYRGNVVSAFSGTAVRGYLASAQEIEGEVLYQASLTEPLNDIQLLYTVNRLPIGPGGAVLVWLTLLLTFVLCTGFYLLYRLGAGQIKLVNQQQDFVSAVSHELKTPLTSIRMYGEMLQAGWADEAKKKSYYDFILDESERLTRLIDNVLQLARMTRHVNKPELTQATAAELLDLIRSKTASQIERAGFVLQVNDNTDKEPDKLKVNKDWFIQIIINLVDNALKFAGKADKKIVEIACSCLSGGYVQFSVRDFGPGIPKDQIKKIFKLFYRAENELTRETVGTGIGLALAQQMLVNMDGRLDVVNKNPGAEFRVILPVMKK